jgi:hypothetical protein
MAESTQAMIHEEALRGIARQQSVIDNLRTRSGTLFAAASLVAAFLGAQALQREPKLDGLAWIAVGSFLVLFVVAMWILWPWSFKFVLNPEILIEDHVSKSVPELQVYLARIWRENYLWNQRRVDQLSVVLRLGLVALVVEVLAWLLRLAD